MNEYRNKLVLPLYLIEILSLKEQNVSFDITYLLDEQFN